MGVKGKGKRFASDPQVAGAGKTLDLTVLPLLAFRWHYWPVWWVFRLVNSLRLAFCSWFEVHLCSFNGSRNGHEKFLNLNKVWVFFFFLARAILKFTWPHSC